MQVPVPAQIQHQNEIQQSMPKAASASAVPGSPKTPDVKTYDAAARELHWSSSAESAPSLSSTVSGEFTSRYLQDFEPVRCLGKGGFGVVFESKNKLDDHRYAVKRIRLPQVEARKRKVMKEVRVLAKLDHKNIVRYYNTWMERPPPGWQEAQDQWWKSYLRQTGFPSITSTSFTSGDVAKGVGDTTAPSESGIQFRSSARSSMLPPRRNDYQDSFSIVFEKNSNEEEEEHSESGGPQSKSTASKSCPRKSFGLSSSSSGDSSCEDAMEWDQANLAAHTATSAGDLVKSRSKEKDEEKEKDKQHTYLYIVMQLCQKTSLKDWLRSHPENRPACPSTPLRMFHDICRGVQYVHAKGLIHRDLKPGNIFFSADGGTLLIGDFGLVTGRQDYEGDDDDASSSSNDDLSDLTDSPAKRGAAAQHTDQVGTELYMSPEQTERRPYDHKVDIYSLGLILFELLVPFSTQVSP